MNPGFGLFRSNKILAVPSWLMYRLGPMRRRGIVPVPEKDGFSNADLLGYPSNHNYVIDDGRLIPTFDLYWRTRLIESLYSNPVDSLLDIGSARGWFVLRAAQRADCTRAVGIDVNPPWIALSKKIAASLEIPGATFHDAFLKDVFDRPDDFGAPFRNVLIINTYHYLFWGSGISERHFTGHEEILEGLHRICSGRVLFANPLEMTNVPNETRRIAAAQGGRAGEYTTARFKEAAGPLFDVEDRGRIAARRLLVLHRR